MVTGSAHVAISPFCPRQMDLRANSWSGNVKGFLAVPVGPRCLPHRSPDLPGIERAAMARAARRPRDSDPARGGGRRTFYTRLGGKQGLRVHPPFSASASTATREQCPDARSVKILLARDLVPPPLSPGCWPVQAHPEQH